MEDWQNGFQEIWDWTKQLRKTVTAEEYVRQLQDRFEAATDEDEKAAFKVCLDHFYARNNDIDGMRQLQIQTLACDPSEIINWIALSGFERCWGNLRTSLAAAKRAVTLSQEKKIWQRHALSTLARSLRALERYEELDRCLVELANLLPKEDEEPDCAPEDDFFRNLDKSKISPETASLYQDYLDRWKGKTHTAWGGLVGQ